MWADSWQSNSLAIKENSSFQFPPPKRKPGTLLDPWVVETVCPPLGHVPWFLYGLACLASSEWSPNQPAARKESYQLWHTLYHWVQTIKMSSGKDKSLRCFSQLGPFENIGSLKPEIIFEVLDWLFSLRYYFPLDLPFWKAVYLLTWLLRKRVRGERELSGSSF